MGSDEKPVAAITINGVLLSEEDASAVHAALLLLAIYGADHRRDAARRLLVLAVG